ncbi:MAG: methionyl-tRNA formyltransferase [Phycisphaerae bacterium]|nr:methionyl-tRNA formyltransferase [Phycisphaerae bacterium]
MNRTGITPHHDGTDMAEYGKGETNRIGLKIVYFGTGEFGLPTLQTLILNRAPVRLVVTAPDRPAGRGLKIRHSPIKDLAVDADIPTLQPGDVNDPYTVRHIAEYGADVGLIIAYGQKIGGDLIRVFSKGIINLHASLLPAYRGAAPINWAIIRGERCTGVTAMQINEQIDAGQILGQTELAIGPVERADELHDRLAQTGPKLILKVFRQIENATATPKPQDASKVSKAPKLKKHSGRIDWQAPADEIAHRIRGLWPWPTAKAMYCPQQGKPIEVAFARAEAVGGGQAGESPGTILPDLTVQCGSGRLAVMEIRPAGGKLMNWDAFVNGRHVQPGDRFESVETSESVDVP